MPKTDSLTTAIFLDYDNVHISLKNVSDVVAKRFDSDILGWLEWFRAGGHAPEDGDTRRIVLARCYINPAQLGQARAAFTRGGFEVIDCPALTSQNKNSADIKMAMDIADLLTHPTRIDEFIILSADADFTPVLHRLRLHDRLTAVFANEFTAAAFRNSAHTLILQEEFIADVLGVEVEDRPSRPSARIVDANEELKFLAGLLENRVTQDGTINKGDIGKIIAQEYPPFYDSNWLGYGTANALARAIAEHSARLTLDTDANGALRGEVADLSEDAKTVIDYIAETVRQSPVPISSAQMISLVRRHFNIKMPDNGYFGAGSMSAMINGQNLATLRFDRTPPGNIYDPTRHELPSDAAGRNSNMGGVDTDVAEALTLISELTDWPLLAPAQLDAIFRHGAQAIGDGLTHMSMLSKEVRDMIAVEVGDEDSPLQHPVARAPINFILQSMIHASVSFAQLNERDSFAEAALTGLVNLFEARVQPMTPAQFELLRARVFGLEADSDPEGQSA